MNRMPPAVEMDVVVGPKAEGARRATGAFGPTATSAATAPDPEVPAKAQRRRFTAEYRLRILKRADACKRPGGLCCNFRAATSGWTTFGKHRTGSPIMPSDNPFKWRQFEPALILHGVRWYLRYALSYRDLEDMMRERGLCVDHTTIYRWVQRYAPEIDKRCRPFLRRTNDSYRIDETYVRVAGAWT